MTILHRIDTRRLQLWVCGSPSKEWMDWLRTTDVPLCPSQLLWRDMGTEPQIASARPFAGASARVVWQAGQGFRHPSPCPRRDVCDRCGKCEVCGCYCHEVLGEETL